MRLGRTTFVHFLTQVVVSVSGFAATFAIAFLLGASGLGQYAVAVAVGFFWLQIPSEAVGSAIAKRMSERADPGRAFAAGILMNLASGVALGALVYVAGTWFATTPSLPDSEFVTVVGSFAAPMALLVVGAAWYKGVRSGLQGQKKVALEGALGAGERALRTGLQVGLMLAGFGVFELVLAHAGSLFLAGLVGLVAFDVRPRVPRRSNFVSLGRFARYSWLGTLQSRTFGWMDTLVLAFVSTSSLIGIYEAAWGLASLLGMVSSSIKRTLFPEMSELSVEDAYDRITHYLDESLVFSGVFIIPGLVGAAIVGERVLEIYRPSFSQGLFVLVILVGAYTLDVYGSQFTNVLNAIDRPDLTFAIALRFIAVNAVLNVVLGVRFGWYGTAVATAISAGLHLLLGYRSLASVVGRPSIPFREIWREILAAVVMGIVLLVIRDAVPETRLWTVAVVGFGAAVYVGALLVVSERVRGKVVLLTRPLRG